MQISRSAVRALAEDHARRQILADEEGNWHAVQLDISDELADATAEITERGGELAGERFRRIYVEEIQAIERDAISDPVRTRARLLRGTRKPGTYRPDVTAPCVALPSPVRPGAAWWVFCVIAGAALVFLI